MSTVSIYLNFPRNTEEAFNFYKEVFGGEFEGHVARMGDAPFAEGQLPLADEDKNLVMHVCLPIIDGFKLMGTDAPESMGLTVNIGNNLYINLLTDTRAETEALFGKLSEGGNIDMPLQDMFWGDYFGSLVDKFGVQWMLNCSEKNIEMSE